MMFRNTVAQKCICGGDWKNNLEENFIDGNIWEQGITSDLLLNRISSTKMSHVSYAIRCGCIREEAWCFPYLKAVPTINLDTPFSLFLALLLHQWSKCKSEDQKEGNRKLPRCAECWWSCCGCAGGFFWQQHWFKQPPALITDQFQVSGERLSF